MRYQNRESEAPASSFRVASGSLRNRYPEPEQVIQQMRFGRVCAGSGGCADTGSHGETGNDECDGQHGEPVRQGVSVKKTIVSGSDW